MSDSLWLAHVALENAALRPALGSMRRRWLLAQRAASTSSTAGASSSGQSEAARIAAAAAVEAMGKAGQAGGSAKSRRWQRRAARLRAAASDVAGAAQADVRQLVHASVRRARRWRERASALAAHALAMHAERQRIESEVAAAAAAAERAAARARDEAAERERQQRKLNFLLTQTELYGHFVAKKGTAKPDAGGDRALAADAAAAAEKALAARDAELAQYDALAKQAASAPISEAERAQIEAKRAEQAARTAHVPDARVHFNEVDARVAAETPQPTLFHGRLKSYQQKGLAWLANLFDQSINGILADEMGLGKTIQSISLLAHLAERRHVWGPFLVVAPSSTLHNWYQEITKFCPALIARPYWGTKPQRDVLRRSWKQSDLGKQTSPWHVVVTSYKLVCKDEKYFNKLKWQYMVLDEAHFLKNSSSTRWRVLLNFKCRNRLLLTGTPIQNNMAELWALLHFIMPTLFDSHAEFSDWFSKDIESHATGLTRKLNEQQLRRLHMVLKPFMLRRVKRDVENEMASKIEKEIYCDLTSHQRKLYRMIRGEFAGGKLGDIAKARLHMGHLMNVLMHLRKVVNHPRLFEAEKAISPFAVTDAVLFAKGDDSGASSFVGCRGESILSRSLPSFAAPLLDLWHRESSTASSEAANDADKRAANYLEENVPFVSAPVSEAEREALHVTSSAQLLKSGAALPLGDRLCGSSRVPLLSRLALWQPHETAKTSSALFSPLRVAGVKPDDAWFAANASVLDRWLAWRAASAEAGGDESHSLLRSPFYVPAARAAALADVRAERALAAALFDDALQRVRAVRAYRPRAVAPGACVHWASLADNRLARQSARVAGERRAPLLLGGVKAPASAAVRSELLVPALGGRRVRAEPLEVPLALRKCAPVGTRVWPRSFESEILASGKLRALDRLLFELKRDGHRVLLYSQMTKMLDVLEEFMAYRKHTYCRLDGSSRLEDRRDLVNDWQGSDALFVFLLSTRAGGIGINLTAADTVIFYDGDWNPTMDEQAMDRTHRLGQTKQVTVYRLLAKGTIEERIMRRARQKQKIHSLVIQSARSKDDEAQDESMAISDASQGELDTDEVLNLLLDDDEADDAAVKAQEVAKLALGKRQANDKAEQAASSSSSAAAKKSKTDEK